MDPFENSPITLTSQSNIGRRVGIIISLFVTLIVIALYVLVNIHVDKVFIEPGTAEPVSSAISYHGVKTYESDGNIRFLTVYVSNERPTALEYLYTKYFKEDVEILPWKDVFGTGTQKDNDEINEALMTSSQNTAKVVALRQLGCSIPETGSGALVVQIEKGTPAEKILQVGDVITSVGTTPITLNSQATDLIGQRSPGDMIELTIERKSRSLTLTTTLGSSPYEAGKAFLGIATMTRDQEFDFPFDITIDPGAVGGPSAGVAFTLSIIDELTRGDLTGGHDIAVTGEIASDGTINPVGGVKEKAVAARKSGADIMIVPMGEGNDARSRAGGMKVYEATTISSVLKILLDVGGDPLEQMQGCGTSE